MSCTARVSQSRDGAVSIALGDFKVVETIHLLSVLRNRSYGNSVVVCYPVMPAWNE